MPPRFLALVAVCGVTLLAAGCSDHSSQNSDSARDDASDLGADASGLVDITGAVFSRTDPSCAVYAGRYRASVTDVGRNIVFAASVQVTSNADGTCTISSNSIPNHDFNNMGAFANVTAEVSESFTIPVPAEASSTTPLSLQYDNAVFLNGVKLDQLAAACYGVGNEPLGREKIGCFTEGTPWRYDPMFAGNSFGTDHNNAHTQPDGAYHYHGDPRAMYDDAGQKASGVIGFAADGYPIYGPYIDDNGTIRKVTSGYVLRSGARASQSGEGAFPAGDYDGTFRDDYEWKAGAGDLDACNGMTRNGSYGYYVTSSYPWVMGCFRGTPHRSFSKRP
ncbi:MAG: YHYH protein [Myxococcales bacterium]|nr:YHYH protein [Myxococcales bacterium]